jgi:TPR repeat protein
MKMYLLIKKNFSNRLRIMFFVLGCLIFYSLYIFIKFSSGSFALEQGDKAFNAKDYALANKCYLKAAAKNNALAERHLGYSYGHGLGVGLDYRESMKWYQKAASQGDAFAESWIGYFYVQGYGVEKDDKESLKWFQKSAANGNDWAEVNIGYSYANGYGVTQDYL